MLSVFLNSRDLSILPRNSISATWPKSERYGTMAKFSNFEVVCFPHKERIGVQFGIVYKNIGDQSPHDR